MTFTCRYISQAMLLGIAWFVGLTSATSEADQREWVTGFEKVEGSCLPIGGLAVPGEVPFPFKTLNECEKNAYAAKFNNNLKRWEGFVLDNGKCFKVWARSVSNPFSLLSKAKCEQERKEMKTALVALEGRGKVKRISEDEALAVGKFALELMFTALTFVHPAFALFIPFLNFLWPSSSSSDAWAKERAKVKAMINQKMNEAYANDLKNYMKDLKREMDNYRGLPAASTDKATKLIAIDTNLGLKERKFMNKKDPVSTMTYYQTYVTTRLVVKRELIQVAKPIAKQQYVREFLNLARRHTIFLGHIAYEAFPKWRKSKLKCKLEQYRIRMVFIFRFIWEDEVTGASKSLTSGAAPKKARADLQPWCKQYSDPVIREMHAYINTVLRQNMQAWASMFNKMAASPFVTGFSATDSKMTVDGTPCMLPFMYQGKQEKCTAKGHTRPWCYKDKNENWGNCFSVGPLSYDFSVCQMSTKYTEQYFGHHNKGENGQLCSRWTKQSTYNSFPMDNNSAELANNYCRRHLSSDYRPWCYTVNNSWAYCKIRACGSKDWE